MTGQATGESLPLSLGPAITDSSWQYYPDGRLAYGERERRQVLVQLRVAGQHQRRQRAVRVGGLQRPELRLQRPEPADKLEPLDQILGTTQTTDYGYDASNGWRTSQGPTSNPSQIQYTYNAQGRMASYTNSASSTSASYSYDAAGQRTKSAVTVSGDHDDHNWVYDGLTLMSLSATQGSTPGGSTTSMMRRALPTVASIAHRRPAARRPTSR